MEEFDLKKYIEENNIKLIVVGTGLSGATIAERFVNAGNGKVLMFEQRKHIAGNIYTKKQHGIEVHKYGSHIFHTNEDRVYDYLSKFTKFHDYQHKVLAVTSNSDVVTMPFNVQTMMQIFKTDNVEDVRTKIEEEIETYFNGLQGSSRENPSNFMDQAIALVGTSIYYSLIHGYTFKQWGRHPRELPAEIIKRLPIRWNSDTTYFNNAKYQGIPIDGYTKMVENMLISDDIHIIYRKFFMSHLSEIDPSIKVIYTGGLDELYNYRLGKLEYRTLEFVEKAILKDTYQGCAVVNHISMETDYTRITEHKFYMPEDQQPKDKTIVSFEYSNEHDPSKNTIPYYPIGNDKNKELHLRYINLLDAEYGNQIIPVGRLATYQYIDMDKTVSLALDVFDKHF